MTILIKYVLYCTSLNSLNRSCPLYNMTSDEKDGWRLDLTFNCLQSCSLAPDHRSLYAERDTAVRSRGRCAGYWGRGMMTPAPLTVSAHPPPRPEQTCRRCRKPLIKYDFIWIINQMATTCGQVSNFRYLKTNCKLFNKLFKYLIPLTKSEASQQPFPEYYAINRSQESVLEAFSNW